MRAGARTRRRFGAIALCAAALLWTPRAGAAAPVPASKPAILYLNSYHLGYSFSDEEMRGFREGLGDRQAGLTLDTFFMDAKRHPKRGTWPLIANLLRDTYLETHPRVVVAADNDAMDFVRHHRGDLLKGVPVVFCGINDWKPEWRAELDPSTGVLETVDLSATFALASALFPQRRRMVVVPDASNTAQLELARVLRLARDRRLPMDVEALDLGALPLDEVTDRLARTTDGACVLVLGAIKDGAGVVHQESEALGRLVAASHGPVFTMVDTRVCSGVLGGRVARAGAQGRAAARMALSIMDGAEPQSLPLVALGPDAFMFDEKALTRWAVPRGSLPKGSIIINHEKGWLERHRGNLASAALAALAMAALFAGFVALDRRRRGAERARRLSEEQYRGLVENANSVIVQMDGGLRVQYLNPYGERLFGWRLEEIKGRSLYDFLSLEGAEKGETLRQVLEGFLQDTRKVRHGVGRSLDHSGKTLWVAWSISALGGKDDPRVILAVGNDVTELRKAEQERHDMEQQVLKTQKLESLGVLAGGIAHDFNNLLTGILGNAELARDEVAGNPTACERLDDIADASHKAAALCQQMLAYSGRGQVLAKPLDLSLLVSEMGRLLQTSVGKRAKVDYRLAKGLPAVMGDATQVRQVAMNLIINASEAVKPGEGRVEVATGVLDCDAAWLKGAYAESAEPGRFVYLSVGDDGCGMDEATQARIFEPFFTTKFAGRGLGLSAVLGIVRGHKGALKIDSRPGQGSTFTALFPALAVAPEAPAPVERRGDYRGGGLALLADDEAAVRTVTRRMLEKMGFTVVEAANGREAVERLRERRGEVRLAILDMSMPGMDGRACLKALRELDPGLPVLVASGYNEVEVAGGFEGRGPDAVLQKPFSAETLAEKIRVVTGG